MNERPRQQWAKDEDDPILYSVADKVATITLNRPHRRNAMTPQMLQGLSDFLWEADADDRVSVVVLAGNGKDFCSGYDLEGGLAMPGENPEAEYRRNVGIGDDIWSMERKQRLRLAIFDMHKPVIAKVHGHCLAGGTDLAFYSDMVIAAESARIGFPAGRDLGTLPSNMWLYHAGPQWAKRLLLTGDLISGKDAATIGLVMKAVADDELDDEVMNLARRLTWIDHHLLAAQKRVINLGMELMGARTLQRLAAEIDAKAHLAPAAVAAFESIAEEGAGALIKRRNAQFGTGTVKVSTPDRYDEEGRLVD